jgi:hypothetical protein
MSRLPFITACPSSFALVHLLAWILSAALAHPACAQSLAAEIRYVVAGNNRLFLEGQGERYTQDLHLYLRCSARKDGKYINDEQDCAQYRQRGGATSVEIPDLRTGRPLDEYLVRYDKVAHTHSPGYAVGGRRRATFSLSNALRDQYAAQLTGCRWRIRGTDGAREILVPDCRPLDQDVELTVSDDGTTMSWRANVQLEVSLADGRTIERETNAVIRDFLIVAMGDSFTSGEGNPERNHSSPIPAQWLDYRCHRSVFSYPVIVAAALALADPRHSVTLIHVACSGAQTTTGVLEPYEGIISKREAANLWRNWRFLTQGRSTVPPRWKRYGTEVDKLPSQLEQVTRALGLAGNKQKRRPDLLLISAGVNDVGFADLLKTLARKSCGDTCFAELRRIRESPDCSGASTTPATLSFQCLEQRLLRMRAALDAILRPQAAYLMQYIDPLRDERNSLCSNDALHKRRLLNGVLGPLQSTLGRVWPVEITVDEFRFAEVDFYIPLKQALSKVTTPAGWSIPPPLEAHEQRQRGFCASPSWYHTFEESKARQRMTPGTLTASTGTLHPNVFGHFYAALRILTRLRADQYLSGHNLLLMDRAEFDPKAAGIKRPDGSDGFAFYLQDMHKSTERIERYYKF